MRSCRIIWHLLLWQERDGEPATCMLLRFGQIITQEGQLGLDAGCAPRWVLAAHATDSFLQRPFELRPFEPRPAGGVG